MLFRTQAVQTSQKVPAAISAPPEPTVSVTTPVDQNRPGLKSEFSLFAAVLVAHAPLLLEHFSNMWARSHYQYFPVVIGAIAYLIYDRWRYQRQETPGSWRIVSGILFVAAIPVLGLGAWLWSPTLGAVSFAICWMACLLLIQHKIRIRNWFGIGLLAWLIVPAPMGLDSQLSNYLQGVTTFVSGLLLDLIGVVNVVDGNTLILSTGRLFVEEACSGIVSLMAVIACSLIIAVWQNRPLFHLMLLVACSIIWAGFMNIMRIVVIGICMVKFGVDLSTGWQHEAVGLLLFAITLLLTASTDRLIGFLVHPIWSGPEQIAKTEKSFLVRMWNRVSALGYPKSDPDLTPEQASELPGRSYLTGQLPMVFTCCFAAIALYSGYGFVARGGTTKVGVPQMLVERTESLNAASLPDQINGWTRVEFQKSRAENRTLFGEYSKIWVYEKDGRQALFSLDYLFNDVWHELCICYENIGWERLDRDVDRSIQPALVRANFQRDNQESGLLHYSMVTVEGRAYDPPSTQSYLSMLKRRMKKGSHRLLQIQLWSPTETRPTNPQREDVRQLFAELRSRLVRGLFSGEVN